jgi:hypothetical protein
MIGRFFARLGVVLTVLWLAFLVVLLFVAKWSDPAGLLVYIGGLAIVGAVVFLGGGFLLGWLFGFRPGANRP